MSAPDYVNNYLDAQMWMFLHWYLPIAGPVLCAFAALLLWQRYQEDSHVNDEDDEFSKKAGKTLGL